MGLVRRMQSRSAARRLAFGAVIVREREAQDVTSVIGIRLLHINSIPTENERKCVIISQQQAGGNINCRGFEEAKRLGWQRTML